MNELSKFRLSSPVLKFDEITLFLILVLVNEVMMHRPIPFHKPNKKKVRNEYTMDHLIPQTK